VGFFSSLFGGPSSQQESLAAQEQSMSSVFNSAFQQYLGSQSQVLGNLGNILTPIAEAGPTQAGFGAQELAALNTQAQQGVGQNYNKASQALNLQESTRGGGNQLLPTGAANAQKENLAASAANQSSNLSSQITEANYAQGNKNWQAATSGLNALGQDYNPSSLGNLGVNETGQAFGAAGTINQEKEAATQGAFGLGASLLGDVIPGAGMLSAGISALNPNADTGLLDTISSFGH
jgi:hypothetical protein